MIFKKTAAVIMAAALMLSNGAYACSNALTASAAQDRTGICAVNYVDVRSDADPDASCKGWLDSGDYISILGEKYDSNGDLWYLILFDQLKGYVPEESISEFRSQDETVNKNFNNDDFESYLDKQAFPESYRIYLRELHKQHPNWIFKAQHLDIDWDTAVKEENVIGRNLVHNDALDSWKSMEKGAYDLNTGEWYQLDTGWVAASDAIIKYYMDPRNFLDEDHIFMFENLSYDPDVQTIDGVKAILRGTFMDGGYTCPDTGEYFTYADTFMEAAKISGVSPYHLASRCRNEQGVYGAPQSLGTAPGYENYFNFFDVQAFATSTMSAGEMGAKFASTSDPDYLLPWTNQYKSIIGGSIFLGTGYITKDQDTLYLQKFDVTDGGNGYFCHQYMTCVFGQANDAVAMLKAYSDEVLASAMEFKIPVYGNMPDIICTKPGSSSDNNDYLDYLSISGAELTQSFNRSTQNYTANATASGVTISAAANGSSSTVYGTGYYELVSEDNVFYVTCVSPCGTQRVYSITIRNGSEYLTAPATDTRDNDVNGDNTVNISDAIIILAHISGRKAMSDEMYDRADIDGNGIVNVADAMTLIKILGLK